MNLNESKVKVKKAFPFPGMLDGSFDRALDNISNTIQKHIERGSKILDFGSGSCEKTAVIQCLGYECSAFDDFGDEWHRQGNNLKTILEFIHKFNIDLKMAENGKLPFPKNHFDMVMSHDVLEHLHDSPREILNDLCGLLKPNGLLFITVPNAVNIRKRIAVLGGQTNLPVFETYYWYPGAWRGHVREYVKKDLRLLSQYLGLEILELRSCHHMLQAFPRKLLPLLPLYKFLTKIFPGWRDTWTLVARKPSDWKPKRTLTENEFNNVMGKYSPYYKNLN